MAVPGPGLLTLSDRTTGVNVVVIGETGHGKSTILGHLKLAGEVSDAVNIDEQRSCSVYDQHKNKIWAPSWMLDQFEEERAQGSTSLLNIELCGFDINLIDFPGAKHQLDEAMKGLHMGSLFILVLSAIPRESECFFNSESHAKQMVQWAKYASEHKRIGFVSVVTKMDAVNWNQERFETLRQRLVEFVNLPGHEVIPVSGEGGYNIWRNSPPAPWYNGRTLVEQLNMIEVPEHHTSLMLSNQDSQQFYFTVGLGGNSAIGKVEWGSIRDEVECIVMPQKLRVRISSIWCHERRILIASPSDIVELRFHEPKRPIRSNSVIFRLDDYRSSSSGKGPVLTELQIILGDIQIKDSFVMFLNGHRMIVTVENLGRRMDGTVIPIRYVRAYDVAGGIVQATVKWVNTAFLIGHHTPLLFALARERRLVAFGKITG